MGNHIAMIYCLPESQPVPMYCGDLLMMALRLILHCWVCTNFDIVFYFRLLGDVNYWISHLYELQGQALAGPQRNYAWGKLEVSSRLTIKLAFILM